MTQTGSKNDALKAPIHFLYNKFIEGTALAQAFGAKKYGDWNFTKGIQYLRLCDAAIRHIIAFMWGEDNDPESGLSHIDHAAANLNMLKFMIHNRTDMDDRYKGNEPKKEEPQYIDLSGTIIINNSGTVRNDIVGSSDSVSFETWKNTPGITTKK